MANKLNIAVGDSVIFLQPGEKNSQGGFKKLTVAGLFTTETELDQIQVFTPLSTLQHNANTVEGFQIHLNNIFSISDVALQIRNQWPFDYYLNSWMQTQGNLYNAIQLSKRLVLLVMLAVIGVAVFNLMTTLTLVVIDKRPSIAILKTMGISRAKVLVIFITQGALIGFLGVFVGALLGVGLSLGIEQGVSGIEEYFGFHFLNTDVYPIDFIPSDVRWQDVSLVMVLAWLLAIFSTAYPAWRATKIEPSVTLQSEH
jgi:lipoprotein-releasing system permease protein